jgi:hypothetical protein
LAVQQSALSKARANRVEEVKVGLIGQTPVSAISSQLSAKATTKRAVADAEC